MDPSLIGPATFAMSQGITAFNVFLPGFAEIRKIDPESDPLDTRDVRSAEVAAVVVTVGVGAIASALTKSNVPVLVSVIVAVGLVVMYENALRTTRPSKETAE